MATSSVPSLDLLLINSPLRDYDRRPRLNDFTLPTIGLVYIATCSEQAGHSADVLDAESLGLGITEIAARVNAAQPRWVGLNLLAPTYKFATQILRRIDPTIKVMLGGHHAKAMPREVLENLAIPRIDALVIGEAENRVVRLLDNINSRTELPLVYWRDRDLIVMPDIRGTDPHLLAPDLELMPLLEPVR